ncbi:MAG: GDSL-type esterase/lipase family protein [Fibrobacteria bacterium]
MTPDFIAIKQDWSVEKALDFIRSIGEDKFQVRKRVFEPKFHKSSRPRKHPKPEIEVTMRFASMREVPSRFRRTALLGILGLSAFAHAVTGDGAADDANIRYVGRWDRSDAAAPVSHWSGAYLRTRFTGTSVKIKLAAATNMMVRIDKKPFVAFKGASGTVDLTAVALSPGTHSLIVAGRGNADELRFQGLILEAGASTQPDSAGKGILEFIGDSISCGDKTTNAQVSAFPWLTGELLGYDHTHICYNGITLVDGYHYTANGSPLVGQEVQYFKLKIPKLNNVAYDGVDPDWDFSAYAPKGIVINLGTNDIGLRVPSATYKAKYLAFLQHIRAKAPDAVLFAMRPFAGLFDKETQEAVASMVSAGDKKVQYINTAGWISSGADMADGVHPSDAGHIKASARLGDAIRPFLEAASPVISLPRTRAKAGGAMRGGVGPAFSRPAGGTADATGRFLSGINF